MTHRSACEVCTALPLGDELECAVCETPLAKSGSAPVVVDRGSASAAPVRKVTSGKEITGTRLTVSPMAFPFRLVTVFIIGVAGVLVIGGLALSTSQTPNQPSPTDELRSPDALESPSGSSDSVAISDTQSAAPEPPLSSNSQAPSGVQSFELLSGVVSRYSQEYFATVNAIESDDWSISLHFDALGPSDLRQPDSSCLVISGDDGNQYLARPIGMDLTTERAGNFAGWLRFPALISGQYGFLYSCADDYTTAVLGSVSIPSLGVSRFSESYYAVVREVRGAQVVFGVHGKSDLREPETSCLRGVGGELAPYVQVTVDYEFERRARTILGSMTFSEDVAGYEFVYSCSGYSAVLMPRI